MSKWTCPPCSLLAGSLIDPDSTHTLSLSEWDALLPLLRGGDLAARLFALLSERGATESVPMVVRRHLLAMKTLADAQARAVRWEVTQLVPVLGALGLDTVLLKGAAYVMADAPPAGGRLFNDIDILVPESRLEEVELALRHAGWLSTHHSAYDQRYYRQWMHELPPMRHVRRQTLLDVHHNLLPRTARLRPDGQKLLAAAVALPAHPGVRVLSPEDMVLHSATHLMHEGEFDHGLRDLHDLTLLFAEFGQRDGFWGRLLARAAEMDLRRPLFYGVRYARRLLQAPVPDEVERALAGAGPGRLARPWMDALFMRAMAPIGSTCEDGWSGLARWLLYVRGHYLRMPLHLLLPHLLRKTWRKEEKD